MKAAGYLHTKHRVAAAIGGQADAREDQESWADCDLLRLVEAEGVTALFSDCLRRQGRLTGLPAGLQSALLAQERQAIAADVRRQEEVAGLLELLHRAGLQFLVLKGEALAHSYYGCSHLRSRSDTDLLFASRAQAERAWRILDGRGFSRGPTLQGEFVGYQFSCTRERGAGWPLQVDIHHQISDYLWFARRLPFAELYRSSEPLRVGRAAVRRPGLPHMLLHACIHRVANSPNDTADRLVWLYDIHLLAGSATAAQWHAFVVLAVEKNLAGVALAGALRAQHYFDTPIDLAVLASAARRESSGLSEDSRRWRLYAADFWLNQGVRNKVVQLREHLLPSSRYMMDKYALRTRVFLPYYYLKRAISGLARYAQ